MHNSRTIVHKVAPAANNTKPFSCLAFSHYLTSRPRNARPERTPMAPLPPLHLSSRAPRKARCVCSRPAISRYTARARPTLIGVMVLMILCGISLSVISALQPVAARARTEAMAACFAALPAPLNAL